MIIDIDSRYRAAAGHAVLPHPGAIAVRTTPRHGRARHAPYDFFSITRGLRTGVFGARWDDIDPLVSNVSGAIYKGHATRELAILEYYIACDLGIVATRTRPNDIFSPPDQPHSIVPTNPTEVEIRQTIVTTPIPADAKWYAVFKGIRTGIFPFW